VRLLTSFRGRYDREIPVFKAAILLAMIAFSCSNSKPNDIVVAEEIPDSSVSNLGKARLSEYGFFKEPLQKLEPAEDVFPYELNAQLFSDYALKKRFIALPAGKKIEFNNEDTLSFPVGSTVIKNFYYAADFRKPEENIRLIETRLLIREVEGWKALTYLWNEQQTDASLEVAGAQVPISWTTEQGTVKTINYSVPNLNQCKSCHMRSDKLSLIGPTARQLNKEVNGKNQLVEWVHAGLINELPAIEKVTKLVSYEDKNISIDARARAWLEINCAHCHRTDAPAKTSGLHLLASVTSPLHIGIGKPPVAAGKGSGGLLYDIVPGKANESIMIYRIASTDPGVMMPELGRSIVHEEGLQLITQWINEMKP
jgi:uncharacterized repeat protein (TIGR03806 family)